MQPRIMYIEHKGDGISGTARVGRVSFSQTGRTLYYGGRTFHPFKGFKANYCEAETTSHYWISGCKKAGGDRLYPGLIEIDDDVREEYWTIIRRKPELSHQKTIRCMGKYPR